MKTKTVYVARHRAYKGRRRAGYRFRFPFRMRVLFLTSAGLIAGSASIATTWVR